MKRFALNAYKVWKAAAHKIGKFQTLLIMTVLFFVIVPVFSLVRLKDPLRKRLGGDSYWESKKNEEQTLERYRRPF